mmetsp:Transcript_22417/g.25787  ORF Transcript_22417/g.25787 Transcript_22417/m.25787 type:complete len:114 (+) Transcript_22417:343-684(+)
MYIYQFSRSSFAENSDCNSSITLMHKLLMSKSDTQLLVCKTWKNYCVVGDSKGNIIVMNQNSCKKKQSKDLINTPAPKLPYKLFKVLKGAHEFEISAAEFITESMKYGEKIIL